MAEALQRLRLYESKTVVEVQSFAPGTYTFPMQPEGNSLLSSLFIRSCDVGATVKINYWDFGAGGELEAGSRYDVQGHRLLGAADAPTTDRIIVTGIHNKPRAEIIITGGAVELGLYLTVVATFASDLDQSLVTHLQDSDLIANKGLVVAGYDPVLNKFVFLPIEDGALKVSGVLETIAGGVTTPANLTVTTHVTPNTETSFVLTGASRFRMTNRGRCAVKYAYASGESATNYATLMPNAPVVEDSILAPTVTVYIQAPSPSQRIEVVSWS